MKPLLSTFVSRKNFIEATSDENIQNDAFLGPGELAFLGMPAFEICLLIEHNLLPINLATLKNGNVPYLDEIVSKNRPLKFKDGTLTGITINGNLTNITLDSDFKLIGTESPHMVTQMEGDLMVTRYEDGTNRYTVDKCIGDRNEMSLTCTNEKIMSGVSMTYDVVDVINKHLPNSIPVPHEQEIIVREFVPSGPEGTLCVNRSTQFSYDGPILTSLVSVYYNKAIRSPEFNFVYNGINYDVLKASPEHVDSSVTYSREGNKTLDTENNSFVRGEFVLTTIEDTSTLEEEREDGNGLTMTFNHRELFDPDVRPDRKLTLADMCICE